MASAAERLTVCSGDSFRAAEDDEYPHVPRVFCEACRRTALHDQIATDLAHHLDAESDPCQDRGVDWPCDVAAALLDRSDAPDLPR